MPLEAKAVFEYLGIKEDEVKDLDTFKEKFDKDFIKTSMITEDSEPVKKILGKTFGTLENEIKKVAKGYELDVDFDAEELKGKKVTDKMKFVFGEYDKKKNTIIEELTAKAGQGNDEKLKDYEKKLEKEQNKAKEFKTLLDATKQEFEGFKDSTAKEIKNTKLNIHKKEIYGKAKFLPDANDFTKKGFFAAFEEKYAFDLDETENPFVIDKKTGNKIISTKVAGTFKTADEVLEEELANAKLLVLNNSANKGKPTPFIPTPPTQNQPPSKGGRMVAPKIGS